MTSLPGGLALLLLAQTYQVPKRSSELWRSKDFKLIQVEEEDADFYSQEIYLVEGKKKRSLIYYSNGNYDGDSKLKVEKDGAFVFEADETGQAKIEGVAFDFQKICKEVKCPGPKACDGSFRQPPHEWPPRFVGVRIRFDPKNKSLSAPESICYDFKAKLP